MGFFNDLGEKVERFKQSAEEAAREEATHVCRNCGERLYSAHEICPECESDRVEPLTESDDGGGQ
jgi:uncharacterized OB-fold protein